MGLRDKERNRQLQAVAARAVVNDDYASTGEFSEYDAVAEQDLDVALNTGLSVEKKTSYKKSSSKKTKQSKQQSTKTGGTPVKHRKAKSSKSSAFKTPTFSGTSDTAGGLDPFEQFAQEGNASLDLNGQAANSKLTNAEIEHEAALLKPPKPEEDIFSTSERRDDIWLFHTAEIDPVHPAEDMTKFRQPGGITGESARNTSDATQNSKAVKQVANETSVKAVQPDPKVTTEITPPIQPENKLRDSFDDSFSSTLGRDSRNNKAISDTLADDKVVRMTNSSSRIAAERLIIDKELRLSQVEVHQEGNDSTQDASVEMPVKKAIKPVQPSKPFKGSVPPIPKGVQQNLKQTLDEVTDNISDASKDDWKNYKNLKNTRSLISTKVDDE